MTEKSYLDLARKAAEEAQKNGAQDARCRVGRYREVQVEWRDGKLDRIRESTTQGLNVDLFVDGRYSGNSTSDLRPTAVSDYVRETVAATRYLAQDPHRKLPDPSRYLGLTSSDLKIHDKAVLEITPENRLAIAQELEAAARDHGGSVSINSVTSSVSDYSSYSACVTTNGFEGEEETTSAWKVVEVSINDEGGRKPQGWDFCGSRFLGDLPSTEKIGAEAMKRALGQMGSNQIATGRYDVIVENRSVPRFARYLIQALSGSRIQQKQSFLEGRLGEQIAAARLSLTSDPLLPGGLASTAWDQEGMAARTLPLVENGTLKNYLLDTYYASKLDMEPTSGSTGNLVWTPGKRSLQAMIGDLDRGLLVTSFLGGNSNAATGDFSVGIKGFLVEKGAIVHPISEMNMAGSHLELWKQLAELGNDPWPYDSNRSPSLLFKDVQISGT